MPGFYEVDPESFIDQAAERPRYGRGAWTRTGIELDYRYAMSDDPAMRIGTRADVSLDHWAVAAGCYAIQRRLVMLGFMSQIGDSERGIFGPRTKEAVQLFQRASTDPDGGAPLADDGTVGRSDSRALFTPIARGIERKLDIPRGYLLGQSNHESGLDPGAVGYYIYYTNNTNETLDYRGVDRGMSQINSKSNAQVSWFEAYDVRTALNWSGERLRSYFDQYKSKYPSQDELILWDAALCAHNNPWAGGQWAKNGYAPTEQAKTYVNGVKTAIY